MSPDGSVVVGNGGPPGHKLDQDDGGAHTRKAGFVGGIGLALGYSRGLDDSP